MTDTPAPAAAVEIARRRLPGAQVASIRGALIDLARAGWLHDPAEVAALRGLLAAARSDLVASGQTAARFERERDELDAENLRLREQAGDMAGQVEELRASLRDEVGKVIRLTAEVDALDAAQPSTQG